jgi:hypothetical protein
LFPHSSSTPFQSFKPLLYPFLPSFPSLPSLPSFFSLHFRLHCFCLPSAPLPLLPFYIHLPFPPLSSPSPLSFLCTLS